MSNKTQQKMFEIICISKIILGLFPTLLMYKVVFFFLSKFEIDFRFIMLSIFFVVFRGLPLYLLIISVTVLFSMDNVEAMLND